MRSVKGATSIAASSAPFAIAVAICANDRFFASMSLRLSLAEASTEATSYIELDPAELKPTVRPFRSAGVLIWILQIGAHDDLVIGRRRAAFQRQRHRQALRHRIVESGIDAALRHLHLIGGEKRHRLAERIDALDIDVEAGIAKIALVERHIGRAAGHARHHRDGDLLRGSRRGQRQQDGESERDAHANASNARRACARAVPPSDRNPRAGRISFASP